MGLEESRNIFLPNVPPPNLVALRPDNLDTRFRIVIIGTLNGQQTYRELIDAVKILLAKYPLITLRIIGTGPDFESLQQYVRNHGLWDITEFTGFVNYQKALSLIAESGIGCALYSGEWTFNYFGDSMKCREYLSFGLPILTTDTHSTVSDIREYQAGVVSERTSVGYAHGLEELISHYETYSAAAITLGNKYANAHSQAYALLTTEVGCETGHRGLDPE
jgi:glycosyltransferase involved in cell wall biosynthesis